MSNVVSNVPVSDTSVFLRLKRGGSLNKSTAQALVAEQVREMGINIADSDVKVVKKMPDVFENTLVFKPGPNGRPVLYAKGGSVNIVA